MENLWFFCAVGAALCWGLSYAAMGRVFEGNHVSVPLWQMLYMACGLPLYTLLSWQTGALAKMTQNLPAQREVILWLAVSIVTSVAGNFMIAFSIAQKNATIASMIEISYPFFTLLFAWLLFREVHLTWATGLGALLIFAGISVIFLKA